MDVHVTTHAIKTDDENDGKRRCAIIRSGTPQRVIHTEEADSDMELHNQVKQQLQDNGWTLATLTTENPIRREELKERELYEAAQDSFRDVMRVLEAGLASAAAGLPGAPTGEQRAVLVQSVMQLLPADLLAEAQRRAGLSDTETRAELLRLAMRMKARNQ